MSDSATTEFGREYQDFEAAALELSRWSMKTRAEASSRRRFFLPTHVRAVMEPTP